jgi:2-polyprenyl-6-methoxyphenol hydroxylase-like FAD-dependent oxidoreductase
MIAIVGGGPAGATLALRLARLGHEVTLVDRGGTRTDGESLNPGIWPLLDALNIRVADGLRIHRSLIRWNSDQVVERHHRVPQLAVLRSSFDAQLRALAGVPIVREIPDASLTIDASGRASWSRPTRIRTSEPMLAMRGIWRGAGLPREARVEALEDGWIWGSPMPDGSFAAIACIDPDATCGSAAADADALVTSHSGGHGHRTPTPAAGESRYFAMLRESLLFRELRGECAVHFSDATTYAAESDSVLRAGDASHTLDPLSSSGVRSAMQSALHASIVVNTIVRHPERTAPALRFYEDARRAAIAEHTRWTRAFYAESRWRDRPFWSARAAEAGAAAEIRGDAPLRVAPGVGIAEVPCAVGDTIEVRAGIAGPALERPFVWIGGVEAARLIQPLGGGAMPREALIRSWRLPQGEQIADELIRAGVLECGCLQPL